MKQIIALVLLFTWMLLIIIMMGEPQMNDQVNESVGSGPQWIGWTLVAFILFTPFIVIKLMDGKTKQAKHNTYIHGMKIIRIIWDAFMNDGTLQDVINSINSLKYK